MARVILSTAIGQASGTVGDLVFRQHNGTTVWQKKPLRRMPWSRRQGHHRDTFGAGAAYAAKVRTDPELRRAYVAAWRRRRKRLNYWQAAIHDYFHAPEIDRMALRDYTPAAGGQLVIDARDDFMVARVHVATRDAAGTLLTFGEAQFESGAWHFTIPPPAVNALPAAVAVVTVFDRPGNFAIGTCAMT